MILVKISDVFVTNKRKMTLLTIFQMFSDPLGNRFQNIYTEDNGKTSENTPFMKIKYYDCGL